MKTSLYIPQIFGLSLEVYFILIILGVPTFFICRKFFRKHVEDSKQRKILTWAVTLVSTPLIYIGLFSLLFYSWTHYPTHDFDSIKWFANKETRYELSDNFIQSEMLIGKTKAEVHQLLGYEGNTDKEDVWFFELGYKPVFLNIDPDTLEIIFKDGKVIEVKQYNG